MNLSPAFKKGFLLAAVVAGGAVVYHFSKRKEAEPEAPQPKNEAVAPDQEAKRQIMRELAKKGGKKSAETRRAKKQAPDQTVSG